MFIFMIIIISISAHVWIVIYHIYLIKLYSFFISHFGTEEVKECLEKCNSRDANAATSSSNIAEAKDMIQQVAKNNILPSLHSDHIQKDMYVILQYVIV